MATKQIIIGSTRTSITGLEVEDVEYLDKKNGSNIINCHYLITESGGIIKTLEHNIEAGSGVENLEDNIVVRYIGGIAHGEEKDTRTRSQIFSIYALVFSLFEEGYNTVIDDGTSSINVNMSFGEDLPEFFKRCKRSISEFKKIKNEISDAQKLASKLIDEGVYKTKEDILNSKYAKIYEYGVNLFNDIVKKHLSRKKELIEITSEKINIKGIGNCGVSKSVLEYIYKISEENGFDPRNFILTTFYENTCLRFCKEGDFVYIKNKKYIHPLYLFNAWSLIKKTYPISKTIKLIKTLYDFDNLTEVQLKSFLSAYILLYNEVKTIHDFDDKTMWKKIYDEITNGTYIPGQNYVMDGYQINSRNLLYYIRRNIELPKI